MRSEFEFVAKADDWNSITDEIPEPFEAYPMQGKTWGCSCCTDTEVLRTKAEKVAAINGVIKDCEEKLEQYRTLLEEVEAIPDSDHVTHFQDEEEY